MTITKVYTTPLITYPMKVYFDNGNSRIVSNENAHRLLVELLMKQNTK